MNRVGNRLSALFKQNQPSFKSADGFPGGVCSNNVSSLIGLPRTADKAKPKTWPKRIPKHNPTYSNIINIVRIVRSLIGYDSVLLWMLSDVNGHPLLLGAAVVLIRVRSLDRFESVVFFSRVRGLRRIVPSQYEYGRNMASVSPCNCVRVSHFWAIDATAIAKWR